MTLKKLLVYAAVLGVIGAYGYQWKSFTSLQTELMAGSIDFGSYFGPVSQFVNENQRWPGLEEVYLRIPPEGGAVTEARLQEEGKILLTLSAWSMFGGNATVTLAPVISDKIGHPAFGSSLVQYKCLKVTPEKISHMVCKSISTVTEAELSAANAEGFEGVKRKLAEADRKRKATKEAEQAAQAAETQCDVLWALAKADVTPCIEALNPTIGAQFMFRADKALNDLRLSGETIVRNPDALKRFNRECESNWRSLVGIYRADYPSCFE